MLSLHAVFPFFAAVDAPVLREIAKVAFGAEKIAQRRAACVDRRRQHLLDRGDERRELRSEEHTSEIQALMRVSYAVFCLKKDNRIITTNNMHTTENDQLIYSKHENYSIT